MLQLSSSEDERENRERVNQERAANVSQVGLEDLQALMSQSRAVQRDPYNKLHGRTVESWQSEEDDEPARPVRLHTSDQLPRRRKKKNKEKREHQSAEDENAAVDRQWRNLMSTTGNLHGASSMPARRQSGSRSAAAASSSQHMSSPSGPQALAIASSPLNITSPSGLGAVGAADSSLSMTARSGSKATGAAGGSSSMSARSGLSNAAAAAEASASSRMRPQSGSAAVSERDDSVSQNPWNAFQMEFAGRHWGSDRMRAEYWKFKATGKKPG
eukprot:s1603_g14.t1